MKVGDLIDSLGVDATIDDADLVAACVVLLKVVDGDGQVRLCTSWSDGMSWIERLGMLTASTATETPPPDSGMEEDA